MNFRVPEKLPYQFEIYEIAKDFVSMSYKHPEVLGMHWSSIDEAKKFIEAKIMKNVVSVEWRPVHDSRVEGIIDRKQMGQTPHSELIAEELKKIKKAKV